MLSVRTGVKAKKLLDLLLAATANEKEIQDEGV